jgi:hypothetical protein
LIFWRISYYYTSQADDLKMAQYGGEHFSFGARCEKIRKKKEQEAKEDEKQSSDKSGVDEKSGSGD